MIGISSSSAGVLLLPKSGTGEYIVLDVVAGEEQDPVSAKYLYSAAQDWREIKGSDPKALLEAATQEYWLERSVSLVRLALGGLESSLEKRVLEHVEEILESRVSSEAVLDRLLVAPLADRYSSVTLAQSALSCGFSAVASILDELRDLQPLLRRLADLWLSLSETAFGEFPEQRETIWAAAAQKCGMKQILRASSKNEFTNRWSQLLFHFPSAQHRSGVHALGQELSRRLFPQGDQQEGTTRNVLEEGERARYRCQERAPSDHETFVRVEKQITAITKAVSEGHDARADKFLRQLIAEQTSSGGGSYAVKSLCNIAQRCADMFRVDFELRCLNTACELDPTDGWALVQYGDHMKRVGNYAEAINSFEKAGKLGESDIAKSCVADVHSQQGDYEKAILLYKRMSHWSDKPEVCTAIADNLRKMGHMDEAEALYQHLIALPQHGLSQSIACTSRGQIGLAEIAKAKGRLEDALKAYNLILKQEEIPDRDRLFYRLGLCNVLKLMENFGEAFSIADTVVQNYPFAMQARFIRGSILGLIGREQDGLTDLPESSGSRSWREWLRHYYRGLLLFKLERYEDARRNLVDELPKAIASGEEKAILRMAAALYFLREDDISRVDGILAEIPSLYDCHAQYLSLVLRLHSAARRSDDATMESLMEEIAKLQVEDVRLEKAVVALRERDFSLALTYEADALLKLAA